MVRLLAIPAEPHPTQESFLLEVLSRSRPDLEVAVLTAASGSFLEDERWNAARLYTFPEIPRRRWIRGVRTYLFDPRYVFHLIRVVRGFAPDVVLVRDLTIPLLVAFVLQPFAGFRLFYQRTYPHEYRWFDPRIVQRHAFPRVWLWCRRVENRLLHALMRRCDAVLTITDAMTEQLVREHGLPRELLHTFGMGVNPLLMEAHEWRQDDSSNDGVFRLAYSGTLGPSRELETLLDAYAYARSRQGKKDLRLEMFGGASEDVARLEKHAVALGVGDHVVFTGELAREEMLRRLGHCDLALNFIPAGPRYWVSCPTKQIEYLALGLPSVATDTVDFVLALARRHGGVALSKPDATSFGQAILEGCDHLTGYRAEAQSARISIRTEFSYDAMATRLVELSR